MTRSSLASWIRCLSPRAVSRRDPSPALASEVRGPVVHQAAPTFEEITARVGRLGIVKLRLMAVSDAQYGGFTTGSNPVSWGQIDQLFVNLTVSIILPPIGVAR